MKIHNNDHDVVYVKVNDMEAYIDEEMATIIKILWQNGIKTSACCQEIIPGSAHIAFPTATDAANFVKFLFGKRKANIINNDRLSFKYRTGCLKSMEQDLLAWGSHGISWTCALLYDCRFTIHFNFPANRIEELKKLLQRKNRQKKEE